jgi:outer membrane murein-binding lipoprotein Lpp
VSRSNGSGPLPDDDPPDETPDSGDTIRLRKLVLAAVADATCWIAACLRAGAEAAAPGNVRDLNALVTALRRLIDTLRAVEAWEPQQRVDPRAVLESLKPIERALYRYYGIDDAGGKGTGRTDSPDDES